MLRVWARMAWRANSQSDKHCPCQSLIAFEGMPTDGLLAGTVCLSSALVGSLRNAVDAHVVRSMEDEGLNV